MNLSQDEVNMTDCFQQFHENDRLLKCVEYEFDTQTGNVREDIFTATMEFSLICDNSWIPRMISSLTFLGFFVGAALAGYLADMFG